VLGVDLPAVAPLVFAVFPDGEPHPGAERRSRSYRM